MDHAGQRGVAASFGWSLYALLFGGAGTAGMRMSFAFTFGQASGHTLYLEAAAGVTTAVLAGGTMEARARVLRDLLCPPWPVWLQTSRCCATG